MITPCERATKPLIICYLELVSIFNRLRVISIWKSRKFQILLIWPCKLHSRSNLITSSESPTEPLTICLYEASLYLKSFKSYKHLNILKFRILLIWPWKFHSRSQVITPFERAIKPLIICYLELVSIFSSLRVISIWKYRKFQILLIWPWKLHSRSNLITSSESPTKPLTICLYEASLYL